MDKNFDFSVVTFYLSVSGLELNPLHGLSCYIYRFPVPVNETVQLLFPVTDSYSYLLLDIRLSYDKISSSNTFVFFPLK